MNQWIKQWWQGKYINPPEPRMHDSWVVMDGYYERHWTSKVAHKVVQFYIEHWKFIWGSLVAIFCASLKFL